MNGEIYRPIDLFSPARTAQAGFFAVIILRLFAGGGEFLDLHFLLLFDVLKPIRGLHTYIFAAEEKNIQSIVQNFPGYDIIKGEKEAEVSNGI